MNTDKLSDKDNKPIETWEFTAQEWNAFTHEAKLLKNDDNLYFGLGILIVGIPYLMFYRDTSFTIASAFVLPFALLLPFLRYRIALKKLQKTNSNATITFYDKYIDMNGKRIDLFIKHKKWIKFMQILESDKGRPPLLEIEIAWGTRNGSTFDEIRIPIPADKMERAEELIKYYQFVQIGKV